MTTSRGSTIVMRPTSVQSIAGGEAHSTQLPQSGVHAPNRKRAKRVDRVTALERATEGITWAARADGLFVDAVSWCVFTGRTAEQLSGWGWLDAVHPDDRASAERRWKRGVARATPFKLEWRVRRHDGEYCALAVRAAPVRNGDDSLHAWICLATDTTERRQIQERLTQALAREHAMHIAAERQRDEAEAARVRAETASHHLRQLQEVMDTALSHRALADLVPALLDRIYAVMAVDSAAILLMTEDGQDLSVYAARGALEDDRLRVPIGKGVAGRIAASRQPLIVDDLSSVELIRPALRHELSSLAGVPLLVEGRCIGVLQVGAAMPRHFAAPDIRLLQLVGDRIALAIDRVQLYELAQEGYADAEIHASELAAMFGAMMDGVLVTDQQGRRLRSNLAFRQLLGLDPRPDAPETPPHERSSLVDVRDAQGQPVPPDSLPTARILRGEVLQGPTALDLTMHALDGRVVEANVTGAPVRTTEGGIVGAIAVYRDITDRRRLERQVAEQASQLEGIFETMADGIVVFDDAGTILRDNAADRAIFGFDTVATTSPRTLDERSQRLLLRDETGRLLSQHEWPAFRVLRGEELRGSGAVELRVQSMDGRELEVSESGAPIHDKAGRIIGGVLVVRDVTERRRLERRTRAALQALLDMAELIVVPDGVANTETASDAASEAGEVLRRLAELTRRLLGCERISFVALDQDTEEPKPILPNDWAPNEGGQWVSHDGWFRLQEHMPAELIEQLRAGDVVTRDAADADHAAPPGWPVQGVGQVLLAPLRIGPRLIGLLRLDFEDGSHQYTPDERALAGAVAQLSAAVLERQRLVRDREEAHTAELAAREATRRMELFMAMAAHEFRTPLTVIKGYLQLADHYLGSSLSEGEIAAPLARALQASRQSLAQARDAAMRMTGLLDDLLQVSRAQAGKLSMRQQSCDLISIVRDSVNEQRRMNPRRRMRLRLPAGRHAPVIADPERLGQVMTNFLTNADKFSPQDEPVDVRIQVSARTARVSIRDRGPGLSTAEQQAIWDRFYQAPGVQRRVGSDAGLGLGLYVCRTIIEQHQGRVGVNSTVGTGSAFWFTLPLSPIGV